MLTALVFRRSDKVSELISKLPPGTNSEAIVKAAFRRGTFNSLSEAFEVVGKIGVTDLRAAAANGAVFQLKSDLSNDKAKIGFAPRQLEKYKEVGLAQDDFVELLCLGIRSGEFSFEKTREFLDLGKQNIVATLSRTVPYEIAGDIIAGDLSNGKPVDVTGIQIFARSYADANPEKAIEWAANLPKENSPAAVSTAFGIWMERNPIAASKFISNMPDSPTRDLGAYVIVRDCVKNAAIDDASSWLLSISDPKLKAEAEEFIQKHQALRK